MNATRKLAFLIPITACGLLTVVYAASPVVDQQPELPGNSYYLYTMDLKVDKSGVAPIPSRYKWSVETSFRGVDVNGKDLPDSRVMLRLYDPDHNFTALTAQMDMATAAKLQQELAAIITKKLEDPTFKHRPRLYDPKDIPTMRFIGIDENGTAIVEEVPKK